MNLATHATTEGCVDQTMLGNDILARECITDDSSLEVLAVIAHHLYLRTRQAGFNKLFDLFCGHHNKCVSQGLSL